MCNVTTMQFKDGDVEFTIELNGETTIADVVPRLQRYLVGDSIEIPVELTNKRPVSSLKEKITLETIGEV